MRQGRPVQPEHPVQPGRLEHLVPLEPSERLGRKHLGRLGHPEQQEP